MRRKRRVTIAAGAISAIVGGAGVVRAATGDDADTPITEIGDEDTPRTNLTRDSLQIS